MFSVQVEAAFKASHQLRFPDGGQEDLHQHDWVVRVSVSTDELDKMGLVVDFNKLNAMIQFIIAPFENDQLEKFDPFTNINSSAENVAKYIYGKLKPMLWAGLKLNFIEVMEAHGCWARYS